MSASPLKYITVPTVSKHTATVIFAHGLGDTGYGWKTEAEMLQRDPALQHIKWILPHAPTMEVTANFGANMPSWFDIYNFGFDEEEDEPGMLQSVRSLNQLITTEIDGGTDPSRIVLGGFSQGSTISLLIGLTGERKLGGLICLSGWLPLRHKFKAASLFYKRTCPQNFHALILVKSKMLGHYAMAMPIFWGTGSADPLVRIDIATKSIKFLKENIGIPETTAPVSSGSLDAPVNGLDFNIYPGMQHSSCPGELAHLKTWLKCALPSKND